MVRELEPMMLGREDWPRERLVLEKMPYDILKKPFRKPVLRRLGIGYKDEKRLSRAAERFLEYVEDWVKKKDVNQKVCCP